MRPWIQSLLLYSIVSGLLFIGACDEYLPQYQKPNAVLEGRVEAQYVLTVIENRVRIFITAVNKYDETLEGRRALSGSIQIRSKRKPELRMTLNIKPLHLTYARSTSAQTGLIRLDPGDSVRFTITWNPLYHEDTLEGSEFAEAFSYTIDPVCPGPPPAPFRTISFRETFIFSGELRVLDKFSPAIIEPTEFSFCRVSQWYDPRVCPPVDQKTCGK